MMQGLFIVLVSSLVFGVSWGDPAGAAVVIVLFALVGTGAAMTVGVFARNADQASALGVVLGMVLGALGGAMVPLELFGEPMSSLAQLTPHAWAIDAFRDLVFSRRRAPGHPRPAGRAGGLRRRARGPRHLGPAPLADARLTGRRGPGAGWSRRAAASGRPAPRRWRSAAAGRRGRRLPGAGLASPVVIECCSLGGR